MTISTETRVELLTPPGSGAIATISLIGSSAWNVARRLFRPAGFLPLPEEPPACSTWFGTIGAEARDEVILAVPAVAPEMSIEIHCHGGRQLVRWLIELLKREGCIEAATNDPEDPWRLLQQAKTVRCASILLDQACGPFQYALSSIEQSLNVGFHVEAEMKLQELARYAPIGRHLVEPWRVVIAGAPNAGKSSLLNALAGYQRSIVASVPGTTRDVVSTTLAFDGWLVELSDTAGLRDEGDSLEKEGIARAKRQIEQSDLCLWVIDTTSSVPSAETRPEAARVIPVLNKVDLPPAWEATQFPEGVLVSAATGAGIDRLIERMIAELVPEVPMPGAAVPYCKTICDRIELLLELARSDRHDELLANFRDWMSSQG